jgi:hypothetical protein
LHDHVGKLLTVVAISRLCLRHAELAFLSACSTTESGGQLVDEAIHLTAAFQITGYRHVIGTLWLVHDRAATRAAIDCYSYLTGGGRHSSYAADARSPCTMWSGGCAPSTRSGQPGGRRTSTSASDEVRPPLRGTHRSGVR